MLLMRRPSSRAEETTEHRGIVFLAVPLGPQSILAFSKVVSKPPILNEFEAEGGFWRVAGRKLRQRRESVRGENFVDDLNNRGVAGGQQQVVPFWIDGPLSFLIMPNSNSLSLPGGVMAPEYNPCCPVRVFANRSRLAQTQPEGTVHRHATSHPTDGSARFFTTCFKGKGKACPVAKLEG